MGRKVNAAIAVTSTSSAPTSIISKRTYTRQILNRVADQTTDTNLITNSVLDNVNMDVFNKTDGKQSEDLSSNNGESNSQSLNVVNTCVLGVKSKRRSALNTQIEDGVETQANTISTISQRPRRQVKHKFIKSANISVIKSNANSLNSNDVSDESTSLLSSLSPNKMRLVPMIHRLPMNASKIDWQGMIGSSPTESNEIQSEVMTVQEMETTSSIGEKMRTERYKELNDSKEVSCISQQLQTPICSDETIDCNDTNLLDEEETIENTITESNLPDAFFDDEDDIMIVEEKDELDVPDSFDIVAGEVVIEESVVNNEHEYAENGCNSPNYFNKISNSFGECGKENRESGLVNKSRDTNVIEMPQTDLTNDESDHQTEPIYLSDSLSCFGSDSDTQDSEMPRSIDSSDAVNGVDYVIMQQTDEDDEIDRLNESADDVIILPECTDSIKIIQSGTENVQYVGSYSKETLIESDLQQSIATDKYEDSENRFKPKCDSPKLYETSTDGDDSSEVERFSVRSRRDNIVRKNYSCRRTYARRNMKNESENENIQEMDRAKNEDISSNESQKTLKIENFNAEKRLGYTIFAKQNTGAILPVSVQDNNTTDGTDEESHFNLVRTKTVRTYVRKNVPSSNSTSEVCDLNLSDSLLKDDEEKETDTEAKNETGIHDKMQSIDSSKYKSTYKPRKRGRPRKKPIPMDAEEIPVAIDESVSNLSKIQNRSPPPETHSTVEMQQLSELTDTVQLIKLQEETDSNNVPSNNNSSISIVKKTEVEFIEISQVKLNSLNMKHFESIDIDCDQLEISTASEKMDYFEEIVSIKKDSDDQKMEDLINIPYAANDSSNQQLVEEPIVVRDQQIQDTTSDDSNVTKPIERELLKLVEPAESSIESISLKIEQIPIKAKPHESIENIKITADVNTLEVRSDETKIKVEEILLQKENEQIDALVNLPKEMIAEIEDTSIRRSGRIRTINKSKQRSQGMGVVKDRKRAPVIVDEDSSNASFDVSTDNILDKYVVQSGTGDLSIRIKTEKELEKERIDRENGMKLFINIADNEYRSERTISKEAKKMTCDCFLTQTEMERGEMGCGDDCLNRMLLIECGPKCVVGDRCTNRRFQKHENSPCNIFNTEKKGYGLIATSYIPAGVFIMEYVGEVLNSKQFEKRANDYSKQMNAHYYFMALSSDCVIDATKKGNISRFINHSCDPNAETQKWTVNGELRIGFFSKKPIMADDEITFDYQFQRYGKEAQKCFCESINCRGWIGGEPDSEDEVESEDDEESDEDATAETTGKDENELSESKVAIAPNETTRKKAKTTKPKKPKDATKKPAEKQRVKTNRKIPNDFNMHMKRPEIMVDPDLDKEIDVLTKSGLKNQVQTLQFSRLMVRAKLQKAKLRLLSLLREGELPCRRLFLDYHGLKLMYSWMSDVNSSDRLLSLKFRFNILQTLENLPITNKTMLQDSKVLSTVQRWSTFNEYAFLKNEPQVEDDNQKVVDHTNDESSPSDSGSGTPLNEDTSSPKVDQTPASLTSNVDSLTVAQKTIESANGSSTSSLGVKPSDVLDAIPHILEQNSTIKCMAVDLLKSIISTTEKNSKIIEDTEKLPDGELGKLVRDICLLASKLVSTWEQLPESFKIPKKLRIEQMKEHEREADESYKENVEDNTAPKSHSTFSSSGRFSERIGKTADISDLREKDPRDKDPRFRRSFNTLSKHQRRQLFEAKVAQEDAERKRTMEHIIHEARCAFFQLDPRITRDFMVPVCVNPTTGQWYGDKMIKIPTPPSHSHIKPPPIPLPTDINEYIIPPIDLPDLWKYAINEKGQIYYYHTKILLPQWEPPIKLLPLMEEHRFNDIPTKVENIEAPLTTTDDDRETEHDCDDEDEDVVSILSNSTMNANCLLELKSDPILEKYNDDDSSSTYSDDSLVNELVELEAKYTFIKEKTDEYWKKNMKRPTNLNEEIAAMAKSDSINITTLSVENTRARDEDNQNNLIAKPNTSQSERKKKKCRTLLVQEIRISPLSEEMKRELRRDSRRYKENKAKLRRQKEMLLKRKSEQKASHVDTPVRKLKKITEGLPQVSKQNMDGDSYGSINNHSLSVALFSSSRYSSDSFETKRTKSSAFSSHSAGGSSASSSSLNTSLNTMDTPTRILQSSRSSLPSTSLTQSIVNKLPSIGHKFVGDTEELIMKNTIKPAEPISTSVNTSIVSTVRNTLTQQTQQQQQLVKKPPHSIATTSKSSPKPLVKKKKTSDSNECIDVNSPAAKKIKEKFKSDISGDIVRHLKPYFSKTCTIGQIQSSDDFRHLARKLTFFVMLKELKYCNNVSLLEVTDSVKNKAREYIKKYMSKFGKTYIRDENEKDYHFEDL